MTNTPILTDVDGVLFDWTTGFIRFLEAEYPHLLPAHGRPLIDNNNVHDWMGRSKDWVSQFIYEYFQTTPRLAQDCPIYPDALQVLPRLAKVTNRKFIAVTAAGLDKRIQNYRIQAIEAVWPGLFEDYLFVMPLTSKRDVLAKYTHAALWVDDAHHHWETGHNLGIPSVHMLRDELRNLTVEHNVDWPTAPDEHVVRDWHGIFSRVVQGKLLAA